MASVVKSGIAKFNVNIVLIVRIVNAMIILQQNNEPNVLNELKVN